MSRAGHPTGGRGLTCIRTRSRSRAAPRRSSATSSVNECSGCPDERGTVDLIPSAEQDAIAAAAAAVLEREAPLAALRSLDGRGSSVDPGSWKTFGELG